MMDENPRVGFWGFPFSAHSSENAVLLRYACVYSFDHTDRRNRVWLEPQALSVGALFYLEAWLRCRSVYEKNCVRLTR